jgi:hypothetical protein
MDKRIEIYNTKLKSDLDKLEEINKIFKSIKYFWSVEEADHWVGVNDKLKFEYTQDGDVLYEGETLAEILAFLKGISYAKEILIGTIEDIADNWSAGDSKRLFESLRTNGCWIKG